MTSGEGGTSLPCDPHSGSSKLGLLPVTPPIPEPKPTLLRTLSSRTIRRPEENCEREGGQCPLRSGSNGVARTSCPARTSCCDLVWKWVLAELPVAMRSAVGTRTRTGSGRSQRPGAAGAAQQRQGAGAAGSRRGGKGLSRGPRVQGEGSPAQPDLTATRQLPSTPGLCPSVTVIDGAGPRPNSKWPRKTFQATQTRGCLKVTPATCRLPSGPPSVPPAMRGLLVTTATSALSPACQPVHHCAASF